ncbi:MAG: hypothetical protein ACD_59C00033G0008 [uncultured bacterium]|nr:MAG: hypothetical protein ACD_59C00033G0008 [uncultured bacterium]
MAADVKKFYIKILLFSLPVIVIFSLSTFVMLISGELDSVDNFIKQPAGEKVVLGLAYSSSFKVLKLKMLLEKPQFPTVLSLGDSRVMQFRSAFFNDKTVFFNAGGGVEKIKEFKYFLNKIPLEKNPEILIVGLDHCFFNSKWDNLRDDGGASKFEHQLSDEYLWDAWRYGIMQVIIDLYNKKINLKKLFDAGGPIRKIGLNAIFNGNGFITDGSYYYGKIISDPGNPESYHDFKFRDTFDRIDKGISRFEYGSEISSGALKELKAFLEECKSRNIYVIGFLPPFAHGVFEKLKTMKDKYGYLFKLEPAIKKIFNEFGYNFFDVSDMRDVGSSDIEAIDGFHGSEKTYLRIFIKLIENDDRLKKYSDINYLKRRLKESKSNFIVFEINE